MLKFGLAKKCSTKAISSLHYVFSSHFVRFRRVEDVQSARAFYLLYENEQNERKTTWWRDTPFLVLGKAIENVVVKLISVHLQQTNYEGWMLKAPPLIHWDYISQTSKISPRE